MSTCGSGWERARRQKLRNNERLVLKGIVRTKPDDARLIENPSTRSNENVEQRTKNGIVRTTDAITAETTRRLISTVCRPENGIESKFVSKLFEPTVREILSVGAAGKRLWSFWPSITSTEEGTHTVSPFDRLASSACMNGLDGMDTLPSSRCSATTVTSRKGSTADAPTRGTPAKEYTT
jgi:hypothetical protein